MTGVSNCVRCGPIDQTRIAMQSLRRALIASCMAWVLSGCGPTSDQRFAEAASTHIRHVIIVVQENRSFDNLFHGFPGADTVDYGSAHDGTRVRLQPVSLAARYDMLNGYSEFETSYDHGKMDGFDLRRILPRSADVPLRAAQYPQYGFVPHPEIKPYLELAQQYVIADRMFQSNIDQSFAAHLYLVAGQASRAVNVPSGRPWGCDAELNVRVPTLRKGRRAGAPVFPCFDMPTLSDELDAKALTWAYYAPRVASGATWRHFYSSRRRNPGGPGHELDFGQLWSAYDAVAHERYGPEWNTNVFSPSARFLADISQGILANVTWVIPDWKDSDHSSSQSSAGPSWVASIVNAVGKSRYWHDSAVLVTWDDSGGWYDHVPPPQLDYDGLGIRVPLLVISPYAKRGFVSHTQYEFGSILRFTERVFSLRTLASSDKRANDLRECFDFNAAPHPFQYISSPYAAGYFERQFPSPRSPDDD